MKRAYFFLLLLIGSFSLLLAQQNHATNVQIHADANQILFTFDILPNGESYAFDVSLKSLNRSIRPRKVEGTGKAIMAKKGLTIRWFYLEDGYTQADLEGMEMEVWAIDPLRTKAPVPNPPPPPGRSMLPLTLGATGLGLLGTGVSMELKAQSHYQVYKENRIEESPIYPYESMNRQELYEDANGRHKRAQIMMISGGVIMGTALLIRQIRKRKNLHKKAYTDNRLNIHPLMSPGLAGSPAPASSAFGLQLGWRF